jgi:hypothetical protein
MQTHRARSLGRDEILQKSTEIEEIVGFGNEHRAIHRVQSLDRGLASRRIDDGQIRPQLAHPPRQGGAIHAAGKIDVGEQNVHRRAGPNSLQGVICVRHCLDRESLVFERLRRDVADQRLILDQQNAGACSHLHRIDHNLSPPP